MRKFVDSRRGEDDSSLMVGKKSSHKHQKQQDLDPLFRESRHERRGDSVGGNEVEQRRRLDQGSVGKSAISQGVDSNKGKRGSIFSTPELAFNDNVRPKGMKRNESIWERSASLKDKSKQTISPFKQKPKVEPLRLDKIKRSGNPNDKQYVAVPSQKSSGKSGSQMGPSAAAASEFTGKKTNEIVSKKSSSYNYAMKQEYTFNPGEASPAHHPAILINGGKLAADMPSSHSRGLPKKSILKDS